MTAQRCSRCPKWTRSGDALMNTWGLDQALPAGSYVWYCPACVVIVRAMRALDGSVPRGRDEDGRLEYGVYV